MTQNGVTGCMTEGIIDLLELIQIKFDQAQMIPMFYSVLYRALDYHHALAGEP
mgnify:CR=1 FL=1